MPENRPAEGCGPSCGADGLAKGAPLPGAFASAADYAVCARLHRLHGTTYYLASRRFPREVRRRVDSVYGFVRVPDEWVDNPGGLSPSEQRAKLDGYLCELLRGLEGVAPSEPVLRAFVDTMRSTGMPVDEPLLFLDAMRMDLEVFAYPSYASLRRYVRGCASAVGLMMGHASGAPLTSEVREHAILLGEAMQMTNFLRDVPQDAALGRVYLPEEDLAAHGVSREDVLQGRWSAAFERLMRFEIARARELYARSDAVIATLPRRTRAPVRVARVLYSRILDRLEGQGANPYVRRARTGRLEKLWVAARVGLLGR
jgi:phytoene synthase